MGLALLVSMMWISIIGLFIALPIVYFRNGFATVKREHGVDWREFLLAVPGFWLSNVVFWPIGVVRWLVRGRPRRSLAVVQLEGREVRTVVDTETYIVERGIARRR